MLQVQYPIPTLSVNTSKHFLTFGHTFPSHFHNPVKTCHRPLGEPLQRLKMWRSVRWIRYHGHVAQAWKSFFKNTFVQPLWAKKTDIRDRIQVSNPLQSHAWKSLNLEKFEILPWGYSPVLDTGSSFLAILLELEESRPHAGMLHSSGPLRQSKVEKRELILEAWESQKDFAKEEIWGA